MDERYLTATGRAELLATLYAELGRPAPSLHDDDTETTTSAPALAARTEAA